MIVAGIDGAKGGWLSVRGALDEDGSLQDPEVAVYGHWRDIPVSDLIAVDMPIGLPETKRRGCDERARSLLGARRSSVFLGLRRPLLAFSNYPAANAWAKSDGAGLSKQAWHLLPKIREIDEAITPPMQERVRETHPELVFSRLNGGPMAASKRSPEGREARHTLLYRNGFTQLKDWAAELDRRLAAPDDLLDGCALAWSAARMAVGDATRLPSGEPPRDARGLRMEIWF